MSHGIFYVICRQSHLGRRYEYIRRSGTEKKIWYRGQLKGLEPCSGHCFASGQDGLIRIDHRRERCGKGNHSRIIHDNSLRKTKKYFAENCGSIPEGTIDSELFGHEKGAFTGAIGEREGYFGAANGGTLFLDEVESCPWPRRHACCVCWRRANTSGSVRATCARQTRIVAATNVNMAQAIRDGRFREDLFYRLNTIPVKMPALRERGDDVVLLFQEVCDGHGGKV